MHVPERERISTTFECMFIDYKAINYPAYGDKLKSFEIYCALFGKCLIKWGYEYCGNLN